MNTCDKPLAAPGLISYRYLGLYGFIMIGATDHNDALREAKRSIGYGEPTIDNLQVWDGSKYVKVV